MYLMISSIESGEKATLDSECILEVYEGFCDKGITYYYGDGNNMGLHALMMLMISVSIKENDVKGFAIQFNNGEWDGYWGFDFYSDNEDSNSALYQAN